MGVWLAPQSPQSRSQVSGILHLYHDFYMYMTCLWYGQAQPQRESRYGPVVELPAGGVPRQGPEFASVCACRPPSPARPFSQIIHAYSSSRPGSTPRAARCGGYIPSPGPKHDFYMKHRARLATGWFHA